MHATALPPQGVSPHEVEGMASVWLLEVSFISLASAVSCDGRWSRNSRNRFQKRRYKM